MPDRLAKIEAQVCEAERLMGRMVAYAHSIGCEVFQDCIMTSPAQAALLAKWWQQNVERHAKN
jgi:hypothetical protein